MIDGGSQAKTTQNRWLRSVDFAILKGKSLGKTVRFVPFAGCSSSVERSVRDREAEGPIPFTPTKLAIIFYTCLN